MATNVSGPLAWGVPSGGPHSIAMTFSLAPCRGFFGIALFKEDGRRRILESPRIFETCLREGTEKHRLTTISFVLSKREEEEKSVKGRRADEESSERKVCTFEFAPATPRLNSDLQTLSLNSDLQTRD